MPFSQHCLKIDNVCLKNEYAFTDWLLRAGNYTRARGNPHLPRVEPPTQAPLRRGFFWPARKNSSTDLATPRAGASHAMPNSGEAPARTGDDGNWPLPLPAIQHARAREAQADKFFNECIEIATRQRKRIATWLRCVSTPANGQQLGWHPRSTAIKSRPVLPRADLLPCRCAAIHPSA